MASGLGWSGQPIPNPGSHTMHLETRAEHDHSFVPEQQRRQPWGKLVGLGFNSNVRTIPMPPNRRFVHVCMCKPLAVRGHLCRLKDHISPF